MAHSKTLVFALLICAFAFSPEHSSARSPARERPLFAVPGEGVLLQSSGRPSSFKSSVADTFYLYGGPGSLLGKYQQSFGSGALPDLQGWSSRDVTDEDPYWQPSTFMSPTGTTAIWAGQTAEQQPGWYSAPGYGNGWNAKLEYRATVSNPAMGQIVDLEFVFNHDTEPGFDFFRVEYDLAGANQTLLSLDGYNQEPWGGPATPLTFPDDVSPLGEIVYTGGDYNGPGGDEIVLRLRVTSDGAWSNQDGLWPSRGAAQVDDIRVTHADGADFEDFEGLPGLFLWQPQHEPFAGNYADIYPAVTDLDPCIENPTPVLGFVDHPGPYYPGDPSAIGDADGYLPKNPRWAGAATAGSTSPTWAYGVPGGWVLNYFGGVSVGAESLHNEWWSPVIDWDIPTTTADDAAEVAGVRIRGSVWYHLPVIQGMLYRWEVRGRELGSQSWSNWKNRDISYFGGSARWTQLDVEVSDLLPEERDALQMRWAVQDIASLYGFPGLNATPAPFFDNTTVMKYRTRGPHFTTRSLDMFQDSFSQSGATSSQLTSPAERELHGVRLDMARDINSGDQGPITPGDSIIVDIISVIPGVAISDSLNQIRLHYALNKNPVFEDALRANRTTTLGATDVAGGMYGWDQTVGYVAAEQSHAGNGTAIADRYAFDLPDDHFMYAGDVLEYYIEAWDDAGNTNTLPADLTGFDDDDAATPLPYDRSFTVRALPTYFNTAGDHPPTLLWNDFGRRHGERVIYSALGQLGLHEGVDFDSYTTTAASSLVSNGLGSAGAHGASADQIQGYGCIIYDGGTLRSGLISNGDNRGSDDKGDDAGVLLSWWDQLGADRNVVHWANGLAYDLDESDGSSTTYMTSVLNANYLSASLRPFIGNQSFPRLVPTAAIAGFDQDTLLGGGCFSIAGPFVANSIWSYSGIPSFDQVTPGSGSVATHAFELAGSPGSSYDPSTIAAAGIYNTMTDGSGGVKKSFLFPYSFHFALSPQDEVAPGNLSARSVLLGEVLTSFGAAHQPNPGAAVATPAAPSSALHPNIPNPFNPSTQLRFTLARPGRGSVKVYNIRGELVRTVAAGEFPAGPNRLEWQGRDDQGAEVSSGVYLVRYQIEGFKRDQKVALVK